ncbi:hypothetical protein H5410_021053 [Solanum commersonii]|uniref:Uncharacterized protein n=1 Tax=Solanum commersonii TaxID=4109 RepID=A0A9J5ZE35_SOLCO|nr:hypothetical protein H5410_021053 [Solanum commersonii]
MKREGKEAAAPDGRTAAGALDGRTVAAAPYGRTVAAAPQGRIDGGVERRRGEDLRNEKWGRMGENRVCM